MPIVDPSVYIPDPLAEEAAVKLLLRMMGENPDRGGLLETPARFIKALRFYTSGYQQHPEDILKVFDDGAEKYDQMIIQRDIPVMSHCEHHLAPFYGVAHIAYIPRKRIVGLSKLKRLTDVFARRLQVQERLTHQIGEALFTQLKPLGVGVVLECRHMCMEMRGVQIPCSATTTSALFGALKDEPETRAEFMSLLARR